MLTAGAVLLHRAARGTPRAESIRIWVGCIGVLASAATVVWYLWPAHFHWGRSLPLELCDLASMAAPIAVLTRKRFYRAVLHFWGLALCTQAFVSPVHEPGTARFVLMWLLHGSIVGLAIFDAAALGFRPAWRDLRAACLAATVYVLTVFVLDASTGFNYGYVGPSAPGVPTIVDALGPWPLRVVWICCIGGGAMVLVMLLWQVARRVGGGGR